MSVRIASAASGSVGCANSTLAQTVCPSITATRFVCALNPISANSTLSIDQFAKHLARLPFHFVFFAVDIGDDVVNDVERRDAGIARTRKRLQGDRENLLHTKSIIECLERDGETGARAIRIGEDASTPAALWRVGF